MATKVQAVISTKSLGLNLNKCKGENGIEAPLFRVIALITGAETKSTNYGDSIKFTGEIEVTVYETGQIVKGFGIYFPGVAEQIVNNALKEGTSIQIALEIGAKPSDTTVGYEWTVSILSDLEESTALADFAKTLALPPVPAN